MQQVCPRCGKVSGEAAPRFCSGCGAPMDGSAPAAAEPPRPEKSAMTAGFFSSFLPGLGQVYNGETAKGYALFLLTIAGFILLLVPGLIVWLYATYDAWAVAGRMNTGGIPFRETRMLPLLTFVAFAVVVVLVVLVLAIVLLVQAMMAALGPLTTGPGSMPMDQFYRIFLP